MIQYVYLKQCEMAYAREIAEGRYMVDRSRPLDSGADASQGDLVGVMAEMAVCLHYGLEYHDIVIVFDTRPGAIPDLIWRDYRVSVKGRERWSSPLDLIIPSHDIHNDIYILVSVRVSVGMCGLRGWIGRDDLLRYPEEEWKWTNDRPGAHRQAKRRYVPVEKLRACRRHDAQR